MRTRVVLDTTPTEEGDLVLARYGEDEFTISFGPRIIMSSRATGSERELAEIVCGPLARAKAPLVVVAGLGMGYTLRAALDLLPKDARVVVAELTPAVVAWCRGPLRGLSGDALADPRVRVETRDVFSVLADLRGACDGVALDLWAGPYERGDRVFTAAALKKCFRAAKPSALVAIWSEQEVAGFERRLAAAGFSDARKIVARRGFRHVNYVARATSSAGAPTHKAKSRPPRRR
jgi:spermidine synthase